MALKNTVKDVHHLLARITHDLQKSERGNKAAAQRVRTSTIKLEKLAKLYRKESIAEEKKSKGKRPAKASAKKKAAPAKKKKVAGKVKAHHLAVKHHAKKAHKAKKSGHSWAL